MVEDSIPVEEVTAHDPFVSVEHLLQDGQRLEMLDELRLVAPRKQREREACCRLKTHAKSLLQQVREAFRQRHTWNKLDEKAIKDYTGSGYRELNEALRSGSATKKQQQRIDAVVRAMSKPRIRVYKGTVYRGAKLPPKIKKTLRAGGTFTDPAFLSTSKEKGKAYFTPGRGRSILFVIESKTGVDVTGDSVHGLKEEEILFRPGTVFRIKSVETGEVGTVVSMEELA